MRPLTQTQMAACAILVLFACAQSAAQEAFVEIREALFIADPADADSAAMLLGCEGDCTTVQFEGEYFVLGRRLERIAAAEISEIEIVRYVATGRVFLIARLRDPGEIGPVAPIRPTIGAVLFDGQMIAESIPVRLPDDRVALGWYDDEVRAQRLAEQLGSPIGVGELEPDSSGSSTMTRD